MGGVSSGECSPSCWKCADTVYSSLCGRICQRIFIQTLHRPRTAACSSPILSLGFPIAPDRRKSYWVENIVSDNLVCLPGQEDSPLVFPMLTLHPRLPPREIDWCFLLYIFSLPLTKLLSLDNVCRILLVSPQTQKHVLCGRKQLTSDQRQKTGGAKLAIRAG